MRSTVLDASEGWAWRAVMPALLLGGNAAGWVLFAVAVLRCANWRSAHRDKAWSWKEGSAGWLAFFGLQVLGGAWSADMDAWAMSLEVKSALWFFPVLLAMPGRSVQKDFWWSVGWSMSVYLLWRLVRAGAHEVLLGQSTEWTYARFSGDVHPTYLGLHAAVAFLGLGRTWGNQMGSKSLWALTLLFALCIGLAGSKAGILASFMAICLGGVLFAMGVVPKEGRSEWLDSLGWRWITFALVLVLSAWMASKPRFAEMASAAEVMVEEAAPVSSSSAGRIAVWKSSWAILREHPLGVGTGDVVPELMLRYECKGVTYAAERRLNPHNQWLQAGVAFGWPGILVLTWAFFSVFLWAWKERDVNVLLCLALVLFHASVESVLEVQRGVVFILWMFMSLAPAHRSDGSTVGVH